METSYIISAFGLFGIVILLFVFVQLRVLSHRKRQKEAAHSAEDAQAIAEQTQFRDAMMAMLGARLKEEALDMRLQPAEPISFKVGPTGGDEEAMLIVLVNVYTGCIKEPENAELFKQHFLDDLVQTIVSKFV